MSIKAVSKKYRIQKSEFRSQKKCGVRSAHFLVDLTCGFL